MDAYELSRLDPSTFEQLANMLALRVLGAGATGFGPGADGGRDGWFEGAAPYPSEAERWSGVWYLQSKFHKPHLSKDPQKWLLDKIKEELAIFSDPGGDRKLPDNWIILTNIDPSGKPETGSFDKAKAIVDEAFPELSNRFHIWGGSKIIGLLTAHPEIAEYYADLVTPGHVISSIYKKIIRSDASIESIVRDLVVTRFDDHQYTKLDQAGSDADNRPGIHTLYTDLPYRSPSQANKRMVAVDLAHTCSLNHNLDLKAPLTESWKKWLLDPKRSRVWFIKGGPGQGKSTSTQFLSQIHRAAIILGPDGPTVTPKQRERADEIRKRALADDIWPLVPRVPVSIELRLFAQWFGARPKGQSRRIITYLAEQLSLSIAQNVSISDLRTSVSAGRWLFVFDGLDEVPGDVKDAVANEVNHFTNDWLISLHADSVVVCTSRPQGYSGQFDEIDHATINLAKLNVIQALACARPVLQIGRSTAESAEAIAILEESAKNPTIREIMTTPLQAHIMAVVVRGGGRPPERKWQLFDNFYEVIKKREANRVLPNPALADILRRDKLLKSLHARLGFELHSRAETSAGATTSVPKDEFKIIVKEVVQSLQEDDIDSTVDIVMEATTERLVLVNTPENGSFVRFDIRPLQEFFAAEYLYEAGDRQDLKDRLLLIARDSHWREVLHFYISALIEENRKPEISVVIEVLQEVNERAFGEDSRLLSMRLAVGAIQAARVIEEGVLEEDRRVRAEFQHCIAALCGCADALQITDSVQPQRSRSWLKKIFLNALTERSEAEALGAVVSLARMIDDPAEAEPLTKYLNVGSRQLQKFTLRALSSQLDPWQQQSSPVWLSAWAMRVVTSDTWRELGKSTDDAYSLICPQEELADEVIIQSGLPLSAAPAFRTIFRNHRYVGLRRNHGGDVIEIDLAGLGALTLSESQVSIESRSWSAEVWDELSRMTGVIRGVYLILASHHGLNGVSSGDVLDWIGEDASVISLLPDSMSSFVHEYGTWARSIDPEIESLGKGYSGYDRALSMQSSKDSVDWELSFRRYPYLVPHFILDQILQEPQLMEGAKSFLNSDAAKPILTKFINDGHADSVIISLIVILEENSKHYSDLRPLIVERASQAKHGRYVSHEHKCHLSMPDDAALLPIVAKNIAFQGSVILRERESSHAVGDRIRHALKDRFNLDVNCLQAVTTNDLVPFDQNIAAQALLAFESSDIKHTAAVAHKVLGLDWSTLSDTVSTILMLALSDGVMAGDESAWAAASEVLARTRDNYEIRTSFNSLLRRWRERTASPVNESLSSLAWH